MANPKAKAEGIYLSPFTTNLVLRPVISIVAGLLIASLLLAVDIALGTGLLPWWGALILSILLSSLFALNDENFKPVPKAYVAILTFLGIRLPIYLTEGDHYWIGRKIGFGYSTDALPYSKDAGNYKEEANGYVYIGRRPISIWKSRADKGDIHLSNVSADGSTIFNELTVNLQVLNPLEWATSDDPILDIAERSRSAFRTIVSFFTGTDNTRVKDAMSKLMEGQNFVSALISEPIGKFPKGSIVQTANGERIFEIVSDEEVDAAKARVRQRILDETAPEMQGLVKSLTGDIKVDVKHVDDHLLPVLEENGARFVYASVSDVSYSEEVERQANIAAGEDYQRVAQIQNAKTINEAQKIMAGGATTPEGQFATMVALARDGHVKINYIPNTDRLTRAAVAGGNAIADKDNSEGKKK